MSDRLLTEEMLGELEFYPIFSDPSDEDIELYEEDRAVSESFELQSLIHNDGLTRDFFDSPNFDPENPDYNDVVY